MSYNLQVLKLYNNLFGGDIASSIGQLRDLQELDLNKNHLNSSIHHELGLCNELDYLALFANLLTGPLPLSPFG